VQIAAQPGVNRFDFRGYPYLSYGYQVPFGRYAKPNENLDPRVALTADKGPFFDANSEVSAAAARYTPDKFRNPPWSGDQALAISVTGGSTVDGLLRLDNDRWRPYNSRNHNSEGQNVLYHDGHVDFERKPIVGVNNDNIFTRQANGASPSYLLEHSLLGAVPNDRNAPVTQSDSIIVP